MERRVVFILLALCCALSMSLPVHALTPPVYPQSFTLLPGEQSSFGFPLTKPGLVQAEVQWQGGMPLMVALTDMSGLVIQAANPAASPARIQYEASAANIAGGMLWKIVVAFPKTSGNAAASGTVNIRYPEIDAAQLSRLEMALAGASKPAATSKKAMSSAHKTTLNQALTILRQPTQQRITTYKANADSSFSSIKSVKSVSMPASGASALAKRPASSRLLSDIQKNAAAIQGVPTLLDVIPASAAPGERIVLHGKNLTVKNGLYQAPFTVRGAYIRYDHTNDPNRPVNVVQVPPLVLTAPIESITQLPDGRQELVTHAPLPPSNSTLSPYDGDVSLTTATGFASNVLPFTYKVSIPVISAVNPNSGKPGQQLSIDGMQFANGDAVHVMLNDGRDAIASSTFVNTSSMRFIVPAYSSRETFNTSIYMSRLINGAQISSPPIVITLMGTEMDITGLSIREAAMDCPMVISGFNFEGTPKVNFKLAGMTYEGKVINASSNAIYVTVPKMGGVSANTPCEVSVTSGAKTSKSLTFTYIPTFVHEVLNVCHFNTDIQFGEPIATFSPVGGDCGYSCGYSLFCISGLPEGPFIMGNHRPSQLIYFGKSGYDDYFPRSTLKNGWKVERIIVTKDDWVSSEHAGAYLAENGIGTSNARARIRWWGDGLSQSLQYEVSILITGPYGTSPY